MFLFGFIFDILIKKQMKEKDNEDIVLLQQ